MRTTVDIDKTVLEELKERARAEQKTLGALITEFAMRCLAEKTKEPRPLRWHSQDMGTPFVDIEDKDAVWAILDSKP